MKKQVKKIKEWLDDNDDKTGHKGTPTKSNITDNESAKIKTSNGVIQGYNGVTMVDDKHQIIVGAEAFGEASLYRPETILPPPPFESTMFEIPRKNRG